MVARFSRHLFRENKMNPRFWFQLDDAPGRLQLPCKKKEVFKKSSEIFQMRFELLTRFLCWQTCMFSTHLVCTCHVGNGRGEACHGNFEVWATPGRENIN